MSNLSKVGGIPLRALTKDTKVNLPAYLHYPVNAEGQASNF